MKIYLPAIEATNILPLHPTRVNKMLNIGKAFLGFVPRPKSRD